MSHNLRHLPDSLIPLGREDAELETAKMFSSLEKSDGSAEDIEWVLCIAERQRYHELMGGGRREAEPEVCYLTGCRLKPGWMAGAPQKPRQQQASPLRHPHCRCRQYYHPYPVPWNHRKQGTISIMQVWGNACTSWNTPRAVKASCWEPSNTGAHSK